MVTFLFRVVADPEASVDRRLPTKRTETILIVGRPLVIRILGHDDLGDRGVRGCCSLGVAGRDCDADAVAEIGVS